MMLKTLFPAERLLLGVGLAVLVADLALIAMSPAVVNWLLLGFAAALVAITLGGGHWYRYSGRSERIGLALAGAGLFILGSVSTGMFGYLLVPYVGERIDPWLIRVDRMLAFDWPAFVEWMSHHPNTTRALGPVYNSSFPQLILVILYLGFRGQSDALHRFLLTGVIGVLGTIGFWAVLPSSGPSAYLDLPDGVLERVRLVVEPAYGAELNRLMTEGLVIIPPPQPLGLVGFPSFHTVMALMVLWFFPRASLLFWPIAALNVAMLPAILLHGGHHLVDLLGGIVMFFIALRYATKAAEYVDKPDSSARSLASPRLDAQ
jgi:hypothetical protein